METVKTLSILLIIGLIIASESANLTGVIDEYLQYLKVHKKPVDRIYDSARVKKFSETLSFVKEKVSTSYELSLNDKADWLEDEINGFFQTRKVHQYQTMDTLVLESDAVTQPESLNWASYNNRFGYPIVPLVQNQGLCGACWAFVSASAVRSVVKLSLAKSKPNPEPEVPLLSSQQLIDCDRSMNNGCNGGDPYYAFQYIEMNGLVSYDDYPFKQKQYECHAIPDSDNRYYLNSFQFLPPRDETLLLRSLLNGPVTIGICGSDATFLYYSRGVYNDENCCTEQNHALLLVGYGSDARDGDYWIAQNSWSTNWGEEGYIRLKRNTGGAGMCGLAVSPIQVTGGRVVGNETIVDDEDSIFERYIVMPVTEAYFWAVDNWEGLAIGLGVSCLLLGILLLATEFCLEDLVRLCCARSSTARNGYTAIPDVPGGGRDINAMHTSEEYIQDSNVSEGGRTHFEIESN